MNEVGMAERNLNGVAAGSLNAGFDSAPAPAGAEQEMAWMQRALHDLSQPLTALECLLYVNREPIAGESLDAGLLRSVMEEGLIECGRITALVRGMQDRILKGEEVL